MNLTWTTMSWARLRCLSLPTKTFIVGFLLVTFVLGVGHLLAHGGCLSPSGMLGYQYHPSPNERKELMMSASCAVSGALVNLGIDHALCYESLLGVLKYGRLLRAQRHVDFCVFVTVVDVFTELKKKLSQNSLGVHYNLWHGEIHISQTKRPSDPLVVITLFHIEKNSRGTAYRAGLGRWLQSFVTGDSMDAFPKTLMEGPLKNLTYEGKQMPVPHEDAKMLKYFYPNSWWKQSDFVSQY